MALIPLKPTALISGLLVWLVRAPRKPSNDGGVALSIAATALLAGGFDWPKLVEIGGFFAKAGAFVFGSGLAIVPFLYGGVVGEHHWLTEQQFLDDWALCQITPGINLIALTILIGRRVMGLRGIFLAVIGLMLPSTVITILLTASYASIRNHPTIAAAVRGVIPATVGLGLVTAFQMAKAPLAKARRESWVSLSLGILLLIAAGLAVLLFKLPVIFVIVSAGLIGGLFHWRSSRTLSEESLA